MESIERMISTSPSKPLLKTGVVDCIAACAECAVICISCADACLAEAQVAELRRCIRLNQDCADICSITARLVSRLLQPEVGVLRAQLEACALICASCGAECRKHAQHHEHCTVCADACRRCDEQCRKALSSLQAAA